MPDVFIAEQNILPELAKSRGAGLSLTYGFHPSPFGEAIAFVAAPGLAGLGFVERGERALALADMMRRWPKAAVREDQAASAPSVARAFDPALWQAEKPLPILPIGSDFDRRVWKALLTVPFGQTATYSDLAAKIGQPGAARVVGAAVGRNPIAFLVPCHRIIGRSGALTGYHWGLARKQAILEWEKRLMDDPGIV
jgi:AraC family transcriptional regulator of adaptative response/methylated-DNA-[protein]-cysteine methyltransferase